MQPKDIAEAAAKSGIVLTEDGQPYAPPKHIGRGDFIGSGVYSIVHKATGRVYIGASKTMGWRWLAHRSALRRGTNRSIGLQRAWDAEGEDAFEFMVVEACSPEQLMAREQYWIDWLTPHKSGHGFNTSTQASGRAGVSHTVATRRKISATKTNPSAEVRQHLRDSHLGNRHPEEVCIAISAHHRWNKVSQQSMAEIRSKYGPVVGTTRERRALGLPTVAQLAQEYGIKHPTIWKVLRHEGRKYQERKGVESCSLN